MVYVICNRELSANWRCKCQTELCWTAQDLKDPFLFHHFFYYSSPLNTVPIFHCFDLPLGLLPWAPTSMGRIFWKHQNYCNVGIWNSCVYSHRSEVKVFNHFTDMWKWMKLDKIMNWKGMKEGRILNRSVND